MHTIWYQLAEKKGSEDWYAFTSLPDEPLAEKVAEDFKGEMSFNGIEIIFEIR
jgi:hypothetical protein